MKQRKMQKNLSKPSTNIISGLNGMSNPALRGKRQLVLRKSPRLLGMTNPESGSSHAALQKSSRLLAKSAMTKPLRSWAPHNLPHLSQISTREHRKPTKSSKTKILPLQTDRKFRPQDSHWYNTTPNFVEIKRGMRRTRDMQFHAGYNCFGIEKRFIIFSGGEQCIHSDKSTGVTWVAVCWKKSACVAYRRKDLEQEHSRLKGYYTKSDLPWYFEGHLICEIEVCGSPSPGNVHEENYDETAISALQHLFQQKFKGDEIEVVELKEDADQITYLPHVVDMHLAIVNRPCSSDSVSNQQ